MPTSLKGVPYAKSDTATSNVIRRFETTAKILAHAVIKVRTKAQNFGLAASYPVYYDAGESFELFNVDISQLYFANATTGQNGTVDIIGIDTSY